MQPSRSKEASFEELGRTFDELERRLKEETKNPRKSVAATTDEGKITLHGRRASWTLFKQALCALFTGKATLTIRRKCQNKTP